MFGLKVTSPNFSTAGAVVNDLNVAMFQSWLINVDNVSSDWSPVKSRFIFIELKVKEFDPLYVTWFAVIVDVPSRPTHGIIGSVSEPNKNESIVKSINELTNWIFPVFNVNDSILTLFLIAGSLALLIFKLLVEVSAINPLILRSFWGLIWKS